MAFAEARIDVFGVCRRGRFRNVDEGGRRSWRFGDEPAFHQSIRRGRGRLDDMAADAPEDGFGLFARAVNGAEGGKMAKILGGEKV